MKPYSVIDEIVITIIGWSIVIIVLMVCYEFFNNCHNLRYVIYWIILILSSVITIETSISLIVCWDISIYDRIVPAFVISIFFVLNQYWLYKVRIANTVGGLIYV